MRSINLRFIVGKTNQLNNYPFVFSAPPKNWLDKYPKLAESCSIEESLEEAVFFG